MRRWIVCLALSAALLLACGCARTGTARGGQSSGSPAESTDGAELTAFVDDEAAAKALAALYGITLVSFSDHVAVYHTGEDPKTVIDRGKENGWPALSIDRKSSAY